MLNANEARNMTAKSGVVMKELHEIKTAIVVAATAGESHILVKYPSDYMANRLKKEGYTIDYYTQLDTSFVKISW